MSHVVFVRLYLHYKLAINWQTRLKLQCFYIYNLVLSL